MKKIYILISLFVLASFLLAACGPTDPPGDKITADEGDQIVFSLSGTHLISTVDGIGPKGVDLRGQDDYLQVGDPIRREANGTVWEFGKVLAIGQNTVTILIYNEAIEIKLQGPKEGNK